jgi:hypothetical protein
MKKIVLLVLLCSFMFISVVICGCEITGDPTTDSALLGAGVGAGIGAIVGDEKGALIGAGVGGLGGYVVGSQKKNQQEMNQLRQEVNTVIVWITNSNGSQLSIRLAKDGRGGYIGPRGEYYASMPSEEQLAAVYGF